MPRSLSDPDLDDDDRRLLESVRDHGWHVLGILEEGESPAFAFTVGLTTSFGHPELLIAGLEIKVMHSLLNALGETIRAGRGYMAGERISDLVDGFDCLTINVDRAHYPEWLGYARWYHRGDAFEVLQVLWPDKQNVLPPSPDAPEWLTVLQPVLGRVTLPN
jgi:hypothetical protein